MFELKINRRELARAQDLLEGYLDEEAVPAAHKRIRTPKLPGMRHLAAEFFAAGLSQNDFNKFLKNHFFFVIFLLICMFIFASLAVLLAIPVLIFISWFHVSCRAKKRSKNFEKDYTALLLSLASTIRTGVDPLFALCESRKMFNKHTVIYNELEKLTNDVNRGLSEVDVIQNFAISIRHPDIKLFRTAFILARLEGSSLGECLQRLARVTRQRQSFRRKIKGAVAMQKLSALGIAACTVVIGIIQFSTNPDALQSALAHSTGSKLLYGGLVLIILGIFWMMNLAKARV